MASLEEQIATLTQAVATLAQLQAQQAQTHAQAPTATGAPRLFDQISNRIPQFVYDPELDKTFDLWYVRYKDVINKDGQTLSDEEKTRIILSKISDTNYTFYSNRLLPKTPTDFNYTETVDLLKKTFKSTSSIFKKRQEFLRLEYDGSSIEEYTGTVLRKFTSSEFKKMSEDQICCMVWIAGLRDVALNDMRTKALQTMEAKPDITLLELEAEVKRLMDIRADSKTIASPTNGINLVRKHQQKKGSGSKYDKPPPSPCPGCKGSHWLKDCPNPKTECRKCKKLGHKEKDCRVKTWSQNKKEEQKINSVIVRAATTTGANRIYRIVQVNGKPITMQLDTGADVTLFNEADWKKLGQPKLQKPTISVRSANHQPISVKGWFSCHVTMGNEELCLKAHVADTETLLGIDWMARDQKLWNILNDSHQINHVGSTTGSACNYLDGAREQLRRSMENEYPQVFQSGLGKCTKLKADIKLKPNATPVFRKARPVPYATLPAVSEELDRLTQQGVLTPVDHSAWAAPVVIVKKKNGSIRMCADYSTGLNDSIEQHRHPLPTADDIFTIINGGKYFTQIDLAEAYLQIELSDQAKDLLCINTHKGIYQFQLLPFGVKSAPGIFQQVMDQLINGIEGAAAYLDDIIITGSTIEEHNTRLKKVMSRIHEFGMRMKLEKCKFLIEEVRFLGFIVDENGRRPDPEKVKAIKNMPVPKDITQVKSFLGLIQFYGAFVNSLFRLRPPLDALTKKETPFVWSRDCQQAFDKIKDVLQSDLLLTHFDPNKPIIVAADASKDGIGGVLSHRFPDGSEKAVFHFSKALNKAQTNYSQIEKEGLALVTAVTKFHKYLHGRQFTLKTDHKPLLSIFGDKKGVPVYSANRLQRWATILLNYQFKIEYVNTLAFGQADALSRLIAEKENGLEHEDQVIAQVEADIADTLEYGCHQFPVNARIIRQLSKKDATLQEVAKWQRVHADYTGPLNGKYYLVMVDAYSKWPEVHTTSSISTSSTVKLFQKVFSQFGVPETLVTDNGPQFASSAFNQFCVEQGITHVRSPPYHPQSNGQAERFVDSLKRALGKLKGEGTCDSALNLFLQSYRSTPCDSSPNQATPAENFIGRPIRTFLNQLLPSVDPRPSDHNYTMEAQFNRQHGARAKEFDAHDKVYVKDYRNLNAPTWTSGIVIRRLGKTLYTVRVNGSAIWKRHANQLRKRGSLSQPEDTPMDLLEGPQNREESETSDISHMPLSSPAPVSSPVPPPPPTVVPRRSTRTTRPPSRLTVDPTKKSYTSLN
ncbi:hypothetical protein CAEBREN_12621 [Caenorhabditis brenneri]|uniref:RNA-directed DNA polymerase n=1 Tax=Caenorhabditis brenneri TaxID=135651 RepID=G0N3L6_CAEBE|nr:hypothetical protein CAEBREN_12621 [Caenorhabditis brenneri]